MKTTILALLALVTISSVGCASVKPCTNATHHNQPHWSVCAMKDGREQTFVNEAQAIDAKFHVISRGACN